MAKTRVLVAHGFYRLPGGEDRYVTDLVAALSDHFDVRLLARRNTQLQPGMGTAARMLYSPSLKEDVLKEMRGFKPDVVHVHNVYPVLGPAIHLAAAELRVPVVMTVHNLRLRCPNGLMFTEGAACRRCEGGAYFNAVLHDCFPTKRQSAAYAAALWSHRYVLRLERHVAHWLAPSRFMADRLASWGMDPARISVVRNAVKVRASSAEGAGEHGLFLGRLSAEKGVDVLLRALAAAGDPPFAIVGDGPDRARLERMARALKLSNTVFSGLVARERAQEELLSCRYLAVPSLWEENAPLAAVEALAVGRPIIASHVGGLPELAASGRGLLFGVGDVAGLASHLVSASNDAQLCARMGTRGHEFARTELSPDAHLSALKDVYESGGLRV